MSSTETYVSISEASRLAGISRSSLYKYWINGGKLSVSKDDRGRPRVHMSELLRVFPDISISSATDDTICDESAAESDKKTQELQLRVSRLEELILAKDVLLEAKEQNLADLRQSLLLLTHKPAQEKEKHKEEKGWIKRFFG